MTGLRWQEFARLLPLFVCLFILPFTHTVALRLLSLFIGAGVALWLWRKSRAPELRSALPPWPWILLWAVVPVLLLPFSHDIPYSAREIKSEIGYGLLALFAGTVLVRGEAAMRVAFAALLAAFAVLTLWAIRSWSLHGHWIHDAPFGGSGTFAAWLVVAMPLLAGAWFCCLFGGATVPLVVGLALLGLGSGFYTEQRILWATFGVQGVVFLLLLARAGRLRIAKLPAMLLALLVAGAAVLALLDAEKRRVGAGTAVETVTAEDPRLKNWKRVAGWIAEKPLTGHGFGRGMMPKAIPEVASRAGGDLFWHAHNVVLDYGFQSGVPGLVSILGLFGSLGLFWWRLARDPDPLRRAIGITGVLVVTGVFVRNMTNDFFVDDSALLFWGITGVLAGAAASRRTA